MTDLTFRTATLADVDAIIPLVESAYRGEASRKGWTTEADFLDGQRIDRQLLIELIKRDDARVILVERDAELIACCELQNQQGIAYFGMFSVAPEGQGNGVGNHLLIEAERFAAREWQCREMSMTVIDIRNELIAWYERRGYRRTGVFKPFPYGDERFGIPRRDDLRFEVLSKALG
ncbi:MAG TPA: GNAT family N-acetyltransferase [Dokdonella sp.]|uniref:GNAT family N-acetyltransferase n=1 Tax=Dokdonella sp. TaxID=2291710 RepID=UPI002D8017E8|nr:GNAT family N-acetyltransferase [Dokdonella sp.]HET9033083.1 GNAT family N-acetyltransferase [Dokdonella sp.]